MNDAVCAKRSRELFEEAKTLLPGGVASPVRAIQPYPFYTESASGCRLKTVDGLEYIDCCLGYGPLLLGHTHPLVMRAVADQLTRGTLFGTPSELEIEPVSYTHLTLPTMAVV